MLRCIVLLGITETGTDLDLPSLFQVDQFRVLADGSVSQIPNSFEAPN